MLVVLAIIATVTMITLSGQATFNSSVLLTDSAYTVALSLRQMQAFGLSSRSFNGTTNTAGYGAHFVKGTGGSYILFADTAKGAFTPLATCPVGASATAPDAKPGDCVYQPADGLVQQYSFGRGISVTNFCGKTAGGSTICSSGTLNSLDITFVRSNTTDTIITGQTSGSTVLTSAEIEVSSPDGNAKRYVCVSQIGQISVSNSRCP